MFGGRQAETEMKEGRMNRPVGHSGLSAHDRNGARQSPAAIRSLVLIDGEMVSPRDQNSMRDIPCDRAPRQ